LFLISLLQAAESCHEAMGLRAEAAAAKREVEGLKLAIADLETKVGERENSQMNTRFECWF
jgi:hypothetical protein